jgi:hypothetical protein
MNVLHCLELFLVGEAAGLDLSVEVLGLVDVACKLRHSLKMQSEALGEEVLHAHHIT